MTAQLFSSGPQGFPGDEDNGSMSSWYILSTLGFYPFCAGTGEYVLGAPLFDCARIKLPNGKVLKIIARDNNPDKLYVKEVMFNGKRQNPTCIRHEKLMQGGELIFVMSDVPNEV